MKLLEGNDSGTQALTSKSHTHPSTTMLHSAMPHPATNGHQISCHSNGSLNNNSSMKGMDHFNGSANKIWTSSAASQMSSLLDTTCTSPSSDGPSKEYLEYTENSHYSSVLAGINNLRRQGQFCDIKLIVEDHEFPVHRAVLAVCSPYLFDFLSCLEDTTEQQPTYKVKDVPSVGFAYLLDFMYTGSLCVPLNEVPLVYATALVLKMESAARACADFLAQHLTAANCLGIRQFSKDRVFQASVDDFIRSNLKDIVHSKSFFGLRDLQVEVVGIDENISDEKMERRLFSLVLDWAKNNLNDLKPKLDRLTEKVNVLYLDSDNTLRDCADIEDTVISSDDDMVQDYKFMARRRSKMTSKGTAQRCISNGNGATPQPFHKFSLNPEEAVSVAEREWSIVATRKTSENAYLAIAILDGHLLAISAHIRAPNSQSSTESVSNGCGSSPNSPPHSNGSNMLTGAGQISPVIRKASIAPLEGMSAARCALGAVALNDQIVVCGGYDRGECLASVEAFSPEVNKWNAMPPMNIARGRFSASAIEGCIYVCGGSDGWKELSCVEKYDPVNKKWKFMASMIKERSSHGMVTLDDKLYVIGGCDGQRSIAQCEVYDPSTNKWSRIAPMNTARSQTCVCTMHGLIFAIGGTDLWNTLNTVEVYNPEADEWTLHSQLNIARRGAGVSIVNDLMVVLGGSDGTQSLISTELYDPITDLWMVGSPLNTPRANLSAVTLNNRLYAIGGFSGKKFLPSLEWLDTDDMEWFGHAPKLNPDSPANGQSPVTTKNGEEKRVKDETPRKAAQVLEEKCKNGKDTHDSQNFCETNNAQNGKEEGNSVKGKGSKKKSKDSSVNGSSSAKS